LNEVRFCCVFLRLVSRPEDAGDGEVERGCLAGDGDVEEMSDAGVCV
jgi:hypothetical protein